MKPAPQPIRVLPRQPRRQGADADSAGSEVVPVLKEPVEPNPRPRPGQLRFQAGRNFVASPVAPEREAAPRERLRRSGSIYAGTGISTRYQERKDIVSMAKISVAVFLVLAVALVVAFVTKNEVEPVDRGPVPEVPKLDPTRI